MSDTSNIIEQALVERSGDTVRVVAQSPGFADEWPAEIERLVRAIGQPASPIVFDDAMFAQPFGKTHVAVVKFRGLDATLQFRFLIVPKALYTNFIADPFLVIDRLPTQWHANSCSDSLTWANEPPPPRTALTLQQVLETGGSPTLLGGVQALLDGGRLIFTRAAPATQLVRDFWQLLPYASQAELWPATFAFSGDLEFHVRVVPSMTGISLDRLLTEEQALDYPHGRYELALQCAIEHNDEREIQRLLRRRTGRQTLRLAIFILVGAIVLAVAMGLLQPK